MPLSYGLPVTWPWAAGMPVKAPYLRAATAQAIALLATPPVFIGAQQVSAQSVPNSTDQQISLDTEFYDNAYGHLDTVMPGNYFCELPGYYLCQGTGGVAYTGGAGATTAGIALSVAGGAITTWYGQRGPNSGTTSQRMCPAVAKLVQLVNTGRAAGDYVSLVLNQNSGAAQNTAVATSRNPWLQAQWVAVPGSFAAPPLPVPTNDTWPSPSATLTAQANSGTATLQVDSAVGLVPGGTLGLDTGTTIAETVTIAGTYTTGSLTVPLTANLASTHLAGALVAVPVSAAFALKNLTNTASFLTFPPVMEAYYAAGTQTLPAQASFPSPGHIIPLDTAATDNYGAFNTGTSTWTAPVAGTYWCYAQSHQGMNSTSEALAAGLTIHSANYHGGTTFTWWGGGQAALPSGGNCAITRRRLRLNAGDTVAAAAWQADSSSATTLMDYIGGSSVSESRLITVWRGA